ncbi:PhoH family protein [soil metagenome]
MAEKRITLEGIDLLNFAGVHDENIELIRQNINATLVLRGDEVFLKGNESDIQSAERIIDEMKFLQKRQSSLSSHDVKLIIDLIGNSKEEKLRMNIPQNASDLKDVIVFKNSSDLVKPRTPTQIEYSQKVKENDIVFAIGPAGTGKTYLAVAFAVAALKNKQVSKIVLARPAVEAGESLGFLPGDLSDKVDPYLRPLYDALEDMMPIDKLKGYLEKNIIEIVPLAYMRGRTLSNAFVILDEAQNSTTTQMKMFLTRLGASSKAIINGDITQIDLPRRDMSGLIEIKNILQNVEGISFVYFNKGDVVRHKLVKDILDAYEKFGTEKDNRR